QEDTMAGWRQPHTATHGITACPSDALCLSSSSAMDARIWTTNGTTSAPRASCQHAITPHSHPLAPPDRPQTPSHNRFGLDSRILYRLATASRHQG
ncbi:hypothetical protein BC831DRAFT_443764, partial [Entophlyctis helioformis]